ISVRQTFRSTLFFNRAYPAFGFDASFINSQYKQLLSGGCEDLIQKDWRLNTRYSLNQILNLKLTLNSGSRIAASDFLDNRNYEVDYYTVGPEITSQPSSYFRGSGDFGYARKKNLADLEMDETADFNQ